MSDYFGTILICRHLCGADKQDLFLRGTDFCRLLKPIPEELKYVEVSLEEGEWRRYFSKDGIREQLSPERERELISNYGAADWLDWTADNWGTKSGIRELDVIQHPGEGHFVMIVWETAWGYVNEDMMNRIEKYLQETFRLTGFRWIGLCPQSGSVEDIER